MVFSAVFMFFGNHGRHSEFGLSQQPAQFNVSGHTAVANRLLRMVRRQQDNLAIAGMISLSGATMAIYSILQAAGIDILA